MSNRSHRLGIDSCLYHNLCYLDLTFSSLILTAQSHHGLYKMASSTSWEIWKALPDEKICHIKVYAKDWNEGDEFTMTPRHWQCLTGYMQRRWRYVSEKLECEFSRSHEGGLKVDVTQDKHRKDPCLLTIHYKSDRGEMMPFIGSPDQEEANDAATLVTANSSGGGGPLTPSSLLPRSASGTSSFLNSCRDLLHLRRKRN